MEISESIHLLGDILGRVLSEQESPAIYEIEERIRQQSKVRRAGDLAAADNLSRELAVLDPNSARAVASAFALYFDLVNLAEENHRVNQLRDYERKSHPEPIHESIGEAVSLLSKAGMTASQMANLVADLKIELVLPPHRSQAPDRSH
jgi:phosphoenolpyruvate carboxylase